MLRAPVTPQHITTLSHRKTPTYLYMPQPACTPYPHPTLPPRPQGSMNILDLPWDALHEIFSHLRDPRVRTGSGENGWRWKRPGEAVGDEADTADAARIQAIKNARLVCRAFNKVASPLLVPWILVSVDRESLRKVDEISRNPDIASGVRGIKIDATYYPKELATDRARFAQRQRHDVLDENNYMSSQLHTDEEEEMRANCSFIIKAWVNALSSIADGATEETEYQVLLREAHNEFRRRHEEMSGMVADGSFAKQLAQSVSRFPAFGSLWIDSDSPRTTRDMHDPLKTFNDRKSLVEFLVSPYIWRDVEKTVPGQRGPDGEMELAVARLILDLPLAIHEAGGVLRGLRLWVVPKLLRNRVLFDPAGREHELRGAFRHLEHFSLVDYSSRVFGGETVIPPERLDPLDRYLAAVVSTPTLRTLRLQLPRRVPYASRYPGASIIAAVASDRLNVLSLEGLLVRQSDLEYLCSRLARRPTYIEFSALTMQTGKWAPIIDVVRRRTATVCAEGKCEVIFEDLVGGEFGTHVERVYVTD